MRFVEKLLIDAPAQPSYAPRVEATAAGSLFRRPRQPPASVVGGGGPVRQMPWEASNRQLAHSSSVPPSISPSSFTTTVSASYREAGGTSANDPSKRLLLGNALSD